MHLLVFMRSAIMGARTLCMYSERHLKELLLTILSCLLHCQFKKFGILYWLLNSCSQELLLINEETILFSFEMVALPT